MTLPIPTGLAAAPPMMTPPDGPRTPPARNTARPGTWRRSRPTGTAALTAAAAALLISVGGCSSAPATPTAASSPPPRRMPAASATPHGGLPDPSRVDFADPAAVSRAALACLWTIDTATDRGQGDAARRAAVYLTPAYAVRLALAPAQPPDPTWVQHRAYARLRLRPVHDDGAPADTATGAYRQWQITTTSVGRDGWRGAVFSVIAFVTLTRSGRGQPWRVAGITMS
jgi:hypothetical protein